MNLLKNLDYLLRVNNLTRAQLSRELNIAPSTINTWFSKGCENISLRFLIKISEYFGVSIDDLVRGRTMQSRFSTNKHHYFLRCPNLKFLLRLARGKKSTFPKSCIGLTRLEIRLVQNKYP